MRAPSGAFSGGLRLKHSKAHEKMVDGILAHKPGPSRWRATAAAWLQMNRYDEETDQTARQEFARTALYCKELRLDQLNSFASTKDKNLRQGLAMPSDLLILVEAFDPNVLQDKDGYHELMRTFPEFCIPEKI